MTTPINSRLAQGLVLRKAQPNERSYILQAEEETAALSFPCKQTPNEIQSRSRRLKQALKAGNIFLGEKAGKIVGYCWVEKKPDGAWFLVDFYVDKLFRGRGVGDWLLRCVVLMSMDAGAKVLRLVISDLNTRSIRFFTGHGAVCKDSVASEGLREYELPLEGAM